MRFYVVSPSRRLRQQRQPHKQQQMFFVVVVVLVWMQPIMGFFTSSSSLSSSSSMFDVSVSLYNNNKRVSAVDQQKWVDMASTTTTSTDDNKSNQWKMNDGWRAIHGVQHQRRVSKSGTEASLLSLPGLNRRKSLIQFLAGAVTVLLPGIPIHPSMAIAAAAAVVDDDTSTTIVATTTTTSETEISTTPPSAKDILSRLGSIPTFVLVQGDTGIPFMIFNGERSATGYFFLSYNIAEQALRDAREKDQTKGSVANIWNAAQVRVVPLSIAMQLALSSKQRVAVNDDPAVQGTGKMSTCPKDMKRELNTYN
jgi:hypothetical protein